MKTILKFVAPAMKLFLMIFFERKYLQGRFFEKTKGGYLWAFHSLWTRNFLRLGPSYPWPVHFSCQISNPDNIMFHPDDLNNFQSRGTYYQCNRAKISIGKGSYIAPNVGLITQNHDPYNLDQHQQAQEIVLGENCWIGMNSVILPGVILGANTIVGAGSVVTRSYTEGNVILAGSPAKPIKKSVPTASRRRS